MFDILPHIFGSIGLVCNISLWQMRKRLHMLILGSASFLCFAAQFYLLEVYTGMYMSLLAAVRIVVAMFTQRVLVMLVFVLLMIGVGVWQYQSPVDVLAILGGVSGTILYFLKNTQSMRYMGPVGGIFWGIHNFLVGAWAQFGTDMLNLGSQLIAIWRFREKNTD